MAKTAFLFPGQGSQEIGMGLDLFEQQDPFFKSLIEYGSDLVKRDLKELCLNGPDSELRKASVLQPALVSVCLGYHNKLTQSGITADVVLGHSLGEITSLAAANVITVDQAVMIAAKRGQLMDKVASICDGGMLAVMFMPLTDVELLLTEINQPDRIVLANDNAPDQVVLSGEIKFLDQFTDMITARKLGKSKRVPVVGPWHSPFLFDVMLEFEKWVESVPFKKPSIPLILNATANTEFHQSTIKHLSSWQLTSPVFWRESMDKLKETGVDTLIEIGPGKVLSGLARVNGFKKETRLVSIQNCQQITEFTAQLERV